MLSTLTLVAIFSLTLADDSTMNAQCAASDDSLAFFQSNLALRQRSASRMDSQRTQRACDKSWKCNTGFCGAAHAQNVANYAVAGSADVHVQSFDKGGSLWCKETYNSGGHIHAFERKSATNANKQQVCESCASLEPEAAKVERASCSLGPQDSDAIRSHLEDCNHCTSGPRNKGDSACFYCSVATGGKPRCSGTKDTQCGALGHHTDMFWVSAAGCRGLPSGRMPPPPPPCKCLECKCLLDGIADRSYAPDKLPDANDIQPAPDCSNIQGACSTAQVAIKRSTAQIIFCKGGTGKNPGPLWAEIVAALEKSSDKAKNEVFGGAYASLSAGSWQTVLVLPAGDIGGWATGRTTGDGEDVTEMKNVATEPHATQRGVCVETTTFALGCLRDHGLPTKGFFDNAAYLEAEGGGVMEPAHFTRAMQTTAANTMWCPESPIAHAYFSGVNSGHAKDAQFVVRAGGMKCYVTAIARATVLPNVRNIQCKPDYATFGSNDLQKITFDLDR